MSKGGGPRGATTLTAESRAGEVYSGEFVMPVTTQRGESLIVIGPPLESTIGERRAGLGEPMHGAVFPSGYRTPARTLYTRK